MEHDNTEVRSAWYRPLESNSPGSEAVPQSADAVSNPSVLPPLRSADTPDEQPRKKPGKKRRPGLIVAAVCLALVALIAVSSRIFPQGVLHGGTSDPPVIPTAPASFPDRDGSAPGGYEDFRDFFDNYYDKTKDITGENTIPRAAPGGEARLPTAPLPEGEELTLRELYERCSPYVVAISATAGSGSLWGTGIVMTTDGYIITNTHVLDGTSAVTVILSDNRRYSAKLVGCDAVSDISVLKIEAEGLVAATFCSDTVHQGDKVVAIGNPLGEELRGTMTDGIISAISRDISYNRHSMTLIQTNAAINEGNSGGPLINMYGQVVGVTNMKMMTSSSLSNIEGIGFAIPVETIEPVVNGLIATGRVTGRPAIGITVGAIPSNAADYFDLPPGLYIGEVSPGSDAEAKGVQVGDILTAVNGTPVTTTKQVADIKNGLVTGDKLTLTLYRAGEYFDVTIELVETSDIY